MSIKNLKKPLPILNTGIYFARISPFSFLSLSVSFSLQLVIEADLQDDVTASIVAFLSRSLELSFHEECTSRPGELASL